jgi:hypothetical protein
MKRDMDLLRSLLLEIEKLPFNNHGMGGQTTIPGRTDEEVCYHALLAQDAGFIDAKFLPGTTAFFVRRLTYQGTEFLELARDNSTWEKAKEKVQSTTGQLTVEGLKIVLSALVQAALRGSLGL